MNKKMEAFTKNTADSIALQSVHVEAELNGLLLQVMSRQHYRNNTQNNIETIYTFPLPWGATLLGMDFVLNGKKMSATVIGKSTAQTQYEEAIDQGDTPVMLEQSGIGLFTANLGNMKPGEEATIELRYAQLQRIEQDQIRIVVPTTIAPRFGNAYQEGGLADHESVEASTLIEYPFTLNVSFNDALANATLHSPSHKIATKLKNGKLAACLESGAFLDRDFVLTLGGLSARSFASYVNDGEQTSILASFCPRLPAHQTKPLSLKILVDCSGSMAGDSMQSARRALHQVLQELDPQDTISYSKFGSTVQHAFLQTQLCTPQKLQRISELVSDTQASMGGTETHAALMSTFKDINSADFIKDTQQTNCVLLITDGSIWDHHEVIEASKKSHHRIFVIGVGSASNDHLLRELAEQTGGTCELVSPNENISHAIVKTFRRMRHAEAMELHVDWGSEPLWESTMPFGVFNNDTIHVFARLSAPPVQAPILMWSGADQLGQVQAESVSSTNDDVLNRLLAAEEIKECESEQERLELALNFQLVTDQTNLFLVHARAAEDIAAGLPELQQIKQMQAAGWGGMNTVLDTSNSLRTPAVWRRESASETVRAMERNSSVNYDVPAFLRRQSDEPDRGAFASPVDLLVDFEKSKNKKFWLLGWGKPFAINRAPHDVYVLIKALEKIVGSTDKAWSVLIEWISQKLAYSLNRHAERFIRNDTSTISAELKAECILRIEALLAEIKRKEWNIKIAEKIAHENTQP